MKKVYVEIKNGFPINMDIQNAIDGFEYLDLEPKSFTKEDVYTGKMDLIALKNPVVGSIDAMYQLFSNIEKLPKPIDFPMEIMTNSDLVKREIQILPLEEAISNFRRTNIPVFIKPVKTKLFDGILVSQESHLHYFAGFINPDVYVSEKIDIVSEHRAYVHKGELKYCCSYGGNFMINPDYGYIKEIIKLYTSSPIAYTIDVAILRNGDTELIEINDMWAIGSYGLYCLNYAEMLLDRYTQILGWEQKS